MPETPPPASIAPASGVVTHEQARESAQRLINSHFQQEPRAHASIPARPDHDDDLIITAYIKQQAALASPPAALAAFNPSDIANDIVREVAELPDRTSPDDHPEAMYVAETELRDIVIQILGDYHAPAARQRSGGAEVVDAARELIDELNKPFVVGIDNMAGTKKAIRRTQRALAALDQEARDGE